MNSCTDRGQSIIDQQTSLDDRVSEIAEIKALIAKLSETHKHKCPQCGTIWEHGSGCKGDSDKHRCPQCNTLQWKTYDDGPS